MLLGSAHRIYLILENWCIFARQPIQIWKSSKIPLNLAFTHWEFEDGIKSIISQAQCQKLSEIPYSTKVWTVCTGKFESWAGSFDKSDNKCQKLSETWNSPKYFFMPNVRNCQKLQTLPNIFSCQMSETVRNLKLCAKYFLML